MTAGNRIIYTTFVLKVLERERYNGTKKYEIDDSLHVIEVEHDELMDFCRFMVDREESEDG